MTRYNTQQRATADNDTEPLTSHAVLRDSSDVTRADGGEGAHEAPRADVVLQQRLADCCHEEGGRLVEDACGGRLEVLSVLLRQEVHQLRGAGDDVRVI